MIKTIIHGKYVNPPVETCVEMSGEEITEQTGYRSTKEIVEGMMLAGQRLEDFRAGMLDQVDEENDDQVMTGPYEKDPVEIERVYNVYMQRKKRLKMEAENAAANAGDNAGKQKLPAGPKNSPREAQESPQEAPEGA